MPKYAICLMNRLLAMKEEKQLNIFNSHCFDLPFTNPREGPDPPKKWFTSKTGTLCPVLPIFGQMWEGDALLQPSESACFHDINKVTSEKKCHNFHTIWKAYQKKHSYHFEMLISVWPNWIYPHQATRKVWGQEPRREAWSKSVTKYRYFQKMCFSHVCQG